MKINEAFPSAFLKADDLKGQDVIAVMESVHLEFIGKATDEDKKVIISFVGKKKKLVANKTNCKTIAKLYGDDTDGWIGKAITLSPREVEFQGDMVWAIRVSLKAPGSPDNPTIGTPVQPVRPSVAGPVTKDQMANVSSIIDPEDLPF